LRHVQTARQDPDLLVGVESADDAAVYRIGEEQALIQTVDFFTPIVDDPYDWGRIAAINALSDVYAMGGRPLTALNLVGWPRALDLELLGRVLDGARDACDEEDVAIVGGHSVDDPEPKFGLAVTGVVHPDRVVRKDGASPGCVLVLTKPLGMGIISSGIKEGKTTPETVAEAVRIMGTSNRAACAAMLEVGAQAATDVTGYGLLGHLVQMLDPSTSAEIALHAIPVLPEAFSLAREGVFPGGSKSNRHATQDRVGVRGLDDSEAAVLFDAQTSGGLLIAVEKKRAGDLVAALKQHEVEWQAVIGELIPGDGRVRVRR
jgi:selenide, water dikinase